MVEKTYNYKITIFGTNVYQEVLLKDLYQDGVIIGTTSASKIRFNRNDFFADFQIEVFLQQTDDADESEQINYWWNVNCSGNIYIQSNSVSKLYMKELRVGEEVVFCYDSSDSEILRLQFTIDFDEIKSDFKKKISLIGYDNLCIGGTEFCKIQLVSELMQNSFITLTKQKKGYVVNENKTNFGLYLNGVRCKDPVIILNDYDFLLFDGYKFYYKQGYLYVDSQDTTIMTRLPFELMDVNNNAFQYPKYVKNARIHTIVESDKIEILPPDKKPEEEEENWFLTIVPSIISLVFMITIRGKMAGNKLFLVYMAATMGMGVITSIFTHKAQVKKRKKDSIKRQKVYTQYIKSKEKYILKQRKIEKEELENIFIDEQKELKQVSEFDYRLFEKGKDDSDFLELRVGKGTVPARKEISISTRECLETNDILMEYPEKLKNAYSMIEDAPVTVDLKQLNVLGVLGRKVDIFGFLKNLTLDIVVRHFYEDVKIYYIFCEEDAYKFRGFRWLQNLNLSDNSLRNMIYSEQSRKILLEVLYKELSYRESLSEKMIAELPYHVVFVYDSTGLASHPISRYLDKAKSLRFVFIYFENQRELIPKQTNKLIEILDYQTGNIVNADDSNDQQKFTYNAISDAEMAYVAERLGCVFVESVSLENSLVKNISLFKLLDIISVSDLDIESRWKKSLVYKSMAAPLGVRASNEIVELDLNEKAHGPHGLVAGTTGSGKSEILQSYILSMATLFHPYDVSFVIIDFKGGGMVNQFKNLPHLNGAITNIDGDAIDRSLSSIRAELRKRQSLFAKYDVNHIDAYIKKYKQGITNTPLPHLILIVDEFAELKTDQPEFMQELISTARIGRSLGVHMILATQKPAGVVNDQIWSNSKFKLCLKVQNKSDSNEVIKSPLAAEIHEPGRAYLQVGNNEIFELFQSAYSGCGADSEQSGKMTEYEINELDLAGLKKNVFSQRNKKNKEVETQLEAIVNYIAQYCKNAGIASLPGICMPELPECVVKDQSQYIEIKKETDIIVEVGIYDDPDNQYQDVLKMNLSQSNTLFIGAPQYGKTNMLQQIMKEFMMKYSARDVNVYILDFASMALKVFSGLNMVGGVITASDDEKMANFFRMMEEEMARRKELFSQMGLTSFSAYKEAGYEDLPQIVVMIDNFTGVKELYLQREDNLLKIVREGISLGICFIVSEVMTNSLGMKYLASFSNRVAFYCNNDGEYSSLFGFCRNKVKNIPGRALIEIDKKFYFFQSYLAFEGKKEIDRINNMRVLMEISNQKHVGLYAKRVPEVPNVFDMQVAQMMGADLMKKPYHAIVGIDYATAEPFAIDFNEKSVLAISCSSEDVSCTLVHNMLIQLYNNAATAPIEVYIFDDFQKRYENFSKYAQTKHYSVEADGVIDIIGQLEADGAQTLQMLREDSEILNKIPFELLVINNSDCYDVINKKKDVLDKYKNIINRYKHMHIGILFTHFENTKIPFSGADVQKLMVEQKNMIVIENINKIKMFDVGLATQREFAKPLGKQDGYFVGENGIAKYKLLL